MLTKDEIAAEGQRIYDERIKKLVEPIENGKFVVVDVDTGEYEMDRDSIAAGLRLIAKNPSGRRFLIRIGYPTAFKIVSLSQARTK